MDSVPLRRRGASGPDRRPDATIPIDPLQNPDLKILFQRASPEAAYDLFQILKQVGSKPAVN